MGPTGYSPELYDQTTPSTIDGDAEWYIELAASCEGRVLELGVGTGRIALPIARAGATVHGLDNDSEMLAALRGRIEGDPVLTKRVVLTLGDLGTFGLSHRFALVIAPFSVLLHNAEYAELESCLGCVFHHLEPGGTFAFNVFHPSLDYMAANVGDFERVWRSTAIVPAASGGFICCSEANEYDAVDQRFVGLRRFEVLDESGWVQRTRVQRFELGYYTPRDLRNALASAGFEQVEIAGGFDDAPLVEGARHLVVRARRPA